MTYLAVRTDNPQAELALYEDEKRIAHELWQADRRLALELIGHVETFLAEAEKQFTDIDGLVVFRGPGSFTGLRIGITVMNTLSYARTIPIVGETGENWQAQGVDRLMGGGDDKVVLPEYGAEARITLPKK